MTDEIKMCKKTYAPEDGWYVGWVPLDPQPNCGTCTYLNEEFECLCSDVTKVSLFIRRPDKMFCAYWKVKQ